ncbi:MAG: ribonuclease P protein component 1 [Candidatus Nanohaloarchaea archaeon]
MPREPGNLVRHELIGLNVEVVGCSDPGKEGLKGEVVDETRKTLVIDSGEEKTVPKDESVFRFELEDGEVDVDGSLLVARPEERILKKFPRKWEYTG